MSVWGRLSFLWALLFSTAFVSSTNPMGRTLHSVSDNEIDAEGVTAIAELLKHNRTLATLK